MVAKSISVGLLLLLCTACASRLARPAMRGTVADYSGQSIAGCTIAKTATDSLGRFYLKEKRSHLWSPFAAPALHFQEELVKEGYDTCFLYVFQPFGGAAGKGVEWNLDTLFLRKKDEAVKLSNIFYRCNWELSATASFDTLYCIDSRAGYVSNIVKEEQEFYVLFNYYRHGGWGKTGSLPDSIRRRSYFINPSTGGTFAVQRVVDYNRKEEQPFKPGDTLSLNGTMVVNGERLTLQSPMSELNGSYYAQPVNRKQMMLVRSTSPK